MLLDVHNYSGLQTETEFLSRGIRFISTNESLSFISVAKYTLSFIQHDMLNPETFLSAKISFLSLHAHSSRIHAFLFTHLSPDAHACYFHCSHHFKLPITLHLARRLRSFEFAQPNIQRLGSLHPGKVALPSSHATCLFLLIYILHFPSYTTAAFSEEIAETHELHNKNGLPNCWPRGLFTENFTILCFLPGHLSKSFSFEFQW